MQSVDRPTVHTDTAHAAQHRSALVRRVRVHLFNISFLSSVFCGALGVPSKVARYVSYGYLRHYKERKVGKLEVELELERLFGKVSNTEDHGRGYVRKGVIVYYMVVLN